MQFNKNTISMVLLSIVILYVMKFIMRKPPVQVTVIAEETEETIPELRDEVTVNSMKPRFKGYMPFYNMRHHRSRYPLLKRN
ncbi:MAG: hypothetical protein CMF62_00710 [Magnetococcales bacterium]|nr:hypothetical protein [Magnetococcales bacterium]|tara:strand:- start:32866 stop:33111 length:246 start_codon:yes stop_codon:yes gene_type:complete